MSRNSSKEFSIDKTWLRNSFSQSASTYNQVAVLQREVASRLIERLDFINLQPQSVLDLGSGTGYCSELLLERYPRASVFSVDIALGMLNYARSQKSWLKKLRQKQSYICGDAETLPIQDDQFDIAVSSLALQWCFDQTAVFENLYRVLKPGSLLMFATMGPDTLKELRQSWAAVDDSAHVSGFFEMHDIGDALVRAGFADPVMDVERIQLTYQKVTDLMKDLKSLGSRNAVSHRSKALTGKAKFSGMQQAYEQFRKDDHLPATYEIVYGHAWIPEQKKSMIHPEKDFPIPVKVRS
ncbi:MAG: malonyl-ACP O-methyltransferase BioC [Gammaproteobacteria bacterium]|nr:malonyl-ACP O-methyltransferase BioC [Gammaproteobacteria bacterium]